MHLAKQVATLQELSGGRLALGIGMGWHRDEFEVMGVEFAGRGARADEAIQLRGAMWSGKRDLDGRWWWFHDASSGPSPSPPPQRWGDAGSGPPIGRARAR